MKRFVSAVSNYITGLRSGLRSTRAAAPKGIAVPGKFQEYKDSAEQGDAEAQFNLGCCYANGQGVGKDIVEAYAWFSMAARADSDAAETRNLLRKGLTPKQFTDAQKRMKVLRWQIAAKSKPSTS